MLVSQNIIEKEILHAKYLEKWNTSYTLISLS